MADIRKYVNSRVADDKRFDLGNYLKTVPDRDLCEMINAHFESHPTLAGEKEMKDTVRQALDRSEWPLNQGVRDGLVNGYSATRIRQTKLNESNWHVMSYLQEDHGDSELNLRHVIDVEWENGIVQIDKVPVSLEKQDSGEVKAYAEYSAWGNTTHVFVGSLPESFLKNNPMNVDQCDAELSIVDYSNGKRKNIAAQIVVDTDIMSGDVLDLNNDVIKDMNRGGPIDENDPDVIASRAADKVLLEDLRNKGIDEQTISEIAAWMDLNPNYKPGRPPGDSVALYHYEQPVIYTDPKAANVGLELALPEEFTENEERWRNVYGECEFKGHESRGTWGIIRYDSYTPLNLGEHMETLSSALETQMDGCGMMRVGNMRLTWQELCMTLKREPSNDNKNDRPTGEELEAEVDPEYADFLKAIQSMSVEGKAVGQESGPEMGGLIY